MQLKLSPNAIIAQDKITNYLLKWRPINDKAGFLRLAGYRSDNWKQLSADIREQILPLDARLEEKTAYGNFYKINGTLTGPNGVNLKVTTIWMIE